MLNSAELEILTIISRTKQHLRDSSKILLFCRYSSFMSSLNFVFSWVEHDKSFITSRPDCLYVCFFGVLLSLTRCTVVPTKSDSGVMFCLQIYQDLESIDHLCINPILRIGLIHK